MSDKLREASEHLQNAQKAMKGGFFSGPNVTKAIDEYEKAGLKFTLAKSNEQSKDAYKKAAELLEKDNEFHHSAKDFDFAGKAAVKAKQINEAADLFSKSGHNYRMSNSVSNAAGLYETAAKLLQDANVDKSVEYYCEAADVWELEDRHNSAYNALRRAVTVALIHKKTEKAVEIFEKQIMLIKEAENGDSEIIAIAAASLIVVYLSLGDFVTAERTYTTYDTEGYMNYNAGVFGRKTIEAYNERDSELMEKCTKLNGWSSLDNRVQMLFKAINIPGCKKKKEIKPSSSPVPQPHSTQIEPGTQPVPTPSYEEEEEDDDEDGVC